MRSVSKTSFVFATETPPDAPSQGIHIIQVYYNDTCIGLCRDVPGRGESLQIYSALGDISLPQMYKII